VARKWPKTKQGKDARAKLETEKAPPPLKAEIPEAVRKKVESMW
jgi:hypothetical protein